MGSTDIISNLGTTETVDSLNKLVPNSKCFTIDKGKHVFAGFEGEIYNTIISWLKKLDNNQF
ncbi:hypothetical protein FACS1894190_18220 [Spirochaetia bacterium]|nr:hypothetical protein FACS1894190_18220 [Spirochaetia bacterium]